MTTSIPCCQATAATGAPSMTRASTAGTVDERVPRWAPSGSDRRVRELTWPSVMLPTHRLRAGTSACSQEIMNVLGPVATIAGSPDPTDGSLTG